MQLLLEDSFAPTKLNESFKYMPYSLIYTDFNNLWSLGSWLLFETQKGHK